VLAKHSALLKSAKSAERFEDKGITADLEEQDEVLCFEADVRSFVVAETWKFCGLRTEDRPAINMRHDSAGQKL
jgi:hypothetical protein